MSDAPGRGPLFRICLAVIYAGGWLVPAPRRREWCAEWTAELVHAWSDPERCGADAHKLFRRCLGAIPDGFFLLAAEGGLSLTPGAFVDAYRALRSSPLAAGLGVTLLVLVLAANFVTLSALPALLFPPMLLPDADRLVEIRSPFAPPGVDIYPFSAWEVASLREGTGSFAPLGTWRPWKPIVEREGTARALWIGAASVDLFDVVRMQPLLGRGLLPADAEAGAEPVVMLAHPMWQQWFGGDRDVVGTTLRIDGVARRIVGVARQEFLPPRSGFVNAWVPSAMEAAPERLDDRNYLVVARLLRKLTPVDAQADVDRWVTSVEPASGGPGPTEVVVVPLVPAWRDRVPSRLLALVVFGLVLLGLAMRQVSRVLGRESTLARVLLITLPAGLMAMPVARLLQSGMRDLAALPFGELHGSVVLGVLVLVALVVRRGTSRVSMRRSWVEVAGAVGIATIALVFAVRQAEPLRADLGYDAEGIVAVSVAGTPDDALGLAPALADQVAAAPAVHGATVVSAPPLGPGHGGLSFHVTGEDNCTSVEAAYRFVDPSYFDVMRIALRGTAPGHGNTIVVNEMFARAAWSGGDALGQTVHVAGAGDYQVVGIIPDVVQTGVGMPIHPAVYFHWSGIPEGLEVRPGFTVLMRSDAPPSVAVLLVESALVEAAADLGIGRASLLAESHARTLRPLRRVFLLSMGGVLLTGVLMALTWVAGRRPSANVRSRGRRTARPAAVLLIALSAGLGLAAARIAQAESVEPPPTAEATAELVIRARELARSQQWEPALAAYQQLVAGNPYSGELLYRMASVQYALQDCPQAIDAYAKAAVLGFQKSSSLYNQACCEALMGDAEAAVSTLEQAIASGLKPREQLIRQDHDFDQIRDTDVFRNRILPQVPSGISRQDGWRLDLDYLTGRLEETHYDAWAHISRDDWDHGVARLVESVPELADYQVIVELMKLVARVGDGHTRVSWPRGGEDAWHQLPISFYRFRDGVFVQGAAAEYGDAVGRRVTSIGGVAIEDALKQVATVCHRDNAMQVRFLAERYLSVPEILHGVGLLAGIGPVEVALAGENGHETTLTVQALERAVARPALYGPTGVWMFGNAPTTPLYRRDPNNLYWFELQENGLLYVQYNAVANRSDDDTIAMFAERLFEVAAQEDVRTLVMDVRNNGGGDNFLNQPLLHGVIRTPKLLERGGLYVITGRRTFSACQNFINSLERHTTAIFVGEPAASRPNFVGEGNHVQLPWSGLDVNASSRLWLGSVSEDAREWIAPDLVAELSSADLVAGRDPAMDVIVAHRGLLADRP